MDELIARIHSNLQITRHLLWNNMMRIVGRGETAERLIIMSDALQASSGTFQEEVARRMPAPRKCCGCCKREWLLPCVPVGQFVWHKTRHWRERVGAWLYSLTSTI